MPGSVRWGVLGTANIALERTIPAIAAVDSAECIAIASRDPERAHSAAEKLGIARGYGSYEALIADPDIEAVYIPLPNQLHVEWATRALVAGKAVLCEKPLALTSSDVRKLIETRDTVGGLIEEALVFRNHPQWFFIEEMIASGRLGTPIAAHGTIAKRFLDPADIRNQPGLGGGATYDLGIYVIAACSIIFACEPLRVSASMDYDPGFGVDRLVTALLDYGHAQASFTACSQGGTAAWGTHQQFSILGSNGWLRSNFPYAQARPAACTLEIGDETSVGAFPTTVRNFLPTDQYALQIERVSRLVRGDDVRHWPIEDSLVTLKVIEALFRSAREGRSIAIT